MIKKIDKIIKKNDLKKKPDLKVNLRPENMSPEIIIK